MPESTTRTWRDTLHLAIGIILIAVSYLTTQMLIDKHRSTLGIKAYIDCINKISTYDWGAHGITEHPSASEICSSRKPR